MTVAACRNCGRIAAVAPGSSGACPHCGWSSGAPHATPPFLPAIRDGLALARGANVLSVMLSLGLFAVEVYIGSSFDPSVAVAALPLAIILGLGLLIAMVGHVVGQFYCASGPASHGAPLAMGSALSTMCAALLFACITVAGHLGIALLVSGALFLLAGTLWVLYFCRLASGLADPRLRAGTRALVAGCVLWLLVLGVLMVRAWSASLARNQSEAITLQLIAGAGNLVFGVGYHFFLNIAVRAVSARVAQTTGRN